MPDTDFDGSSDIFKLKNMFYLALILLLLLQLLKLYFDCKNSRKGEWLFSFLFFGGEGRENSHSSLYGALHKQRNQQI